jgi:peptidoglycan/xylan/chitin deacetylase (PgdA/CDA1 family)
VILRSLPASPEKIFLTFDDGPDARGTPAVLDVLRRKNVPATFFLVAEKLREEPTLVERIQREGHAIGNHSWDHRYRHLFRGSGHLKNWLMRAEAEFTERGVLRVVGFRPPAGMMTPNLLRAAGELNLPVILWNERFYDSVWKWSEGRALRSARAIRGGSIVLLHDRQRTGRIQTFCACLDIYIDAIRARGLSFAALS